MREIIMENKYYFSGTIQELRDLVQNRKRNMLP